MWTYEWEKMKFGIILTVLLTIPTIGCTENGACRASVRQLVGTYETQFQYGSEQLTLAPDMTFVQVFNSAHGQITTRGNWKKSNQFLGPSEVFLIGNYSSERNAPDSRPTYGQRILIVHREQGKLKLALNEAADWYYDRVR